MAWYDRLLGRTTEVEEKLNPAQTFIALDEGLTIDTREKKDNYRSAYEELEVVNRAVNMIVDDTADIPFAIGQKVNGKLQNNTPLHKAHRVHHGWAPSRDVLVIVLVVVFRCKK